MADVWPPNPFTNEVSFTTLDTIYFYVMLVFVAPVRLFLVVIIFSLSYLVCLLAMFGLTENPQTPLSGIRKKLKDISVQLTACWLAIIGFHRCVLKGNRAERWEAPVVVFAPHSGFFDAYAQILIGCPSFVAEANLFSTRFFGKLLQMSAPIPVVRDVKDSRKRAIELIKDRAEKLLTEREVTRGKLWPQTLIYPEGTCSNLSQLLVFKPGAFYPQLPVQPVCLKWSMPYNHISWCWTGPDEWQLLFLTVTQLETSLVCEFLPVHIPSEEEKVNTMLFARNVRSKMAECLKVPTSEYTYEDATYLTTFLKPRLGKFWRLYDDLPLTHPPNSVEELIEVWNLLLKTKYAIEFHFILNVNQFAELLDCEYEPAIQRVFNAFDWHCSGRIDIREFIITRHAYPESVRYLQASFNMFEDPNHLISEVDFIKMFRFPYEQSIDECRALFSLVCGKENDFQPTFERLRLVLNKQVNFMHLFVAPPPDA